MRLKISFREENGGIAACSNSALALADGAWCALLDQDDLLAESALAEVVRESAHHPDAGIIYSDEDFIDSLGVRTNPFFKSDWNPELFLGQNYLNHLGVYRTQLVREVGGFREGFEGSQDYDLALRCSERLRGGQIRHIPQILYHWRMVEAAWQISRCKTATRATRPASAFQSHCSPPNVRPRPRLPGTRSPHRNI